VTIETFPPHKPCKQENSVNLTVLGAVVTLPAANDPLNGSEQNMSQSPKPPGSFLPLHPLEFRILMILLGGASHGYAIVQEIESREKGTKSIYPANLYRRIRDLLSKSLVEDSPPPEGGSADPRRRYFQVTKLGREVVRAETERLEGLLEEARERGLLSTAGRYGREDQRRTD